MSHEINNRIQLRKLYDTKFLPLLAKFNGKVYNARFSHELHKQLQEIDPLLFCKVESQNDKEITLTLNKYNKQYNYTDRESLYLKIVCDCPDGYTYRINEEKTKADQLAAVWLQNFDKYTEEKRTAAKNFDKFLKVANKMEAAIKEFNALPQDFRKIIDNI